MFSDRTEAGMQLAGRLSQFEKENSIVYGLPRGGIPVAYEVASRLAKRLEALIVKKIGAPGQEELALGAVCEGNPPVFYFNRDLMDYLRLERDMLQPLIDTKLNEIAEIQYLYRKGEQMFLDTSATALVVDDGIATGATVRAAIKFLREIGQRRIIVAVPVAQTSVIEELERMVDQVVCVNPVRSMYAVGEFFQDFSQVSHETVKKLLLKAKEELEK